MSDLKSLQQQFVCALQEPALQDTFQQQILDQGGLNAQQRLSIYQNAYQQRLLKVLRVDFPVLLESLNDKVFEELARVYIDKYPSQTRSLRDFGRCFPEFLRSLVESDDREFLAELADFENRLRDSFDAAGAMRQSFSVMQELQPEQWPTARLRFHPSVQWFHTKWNSVSAWQSIKSGEFSRSTKPAIKSADGYWLIWRDRQRLSRFQSLNPAELSLLQSLLQGENLAQACEKLTTEMDESQIPEFLTTCLRTWFESGLIAKIDTDQ